VHKWALNADWATCNGFHYTLTFVTHCILDWTNVATTVVDVYVEN